MNSFKEFCIRQLVRIANSLGEGRDKVVFYREDPWGSIAGLRKTCENYWETEMTGLDHTFKVSILAIPLDPAAQDASDFNPVFKEKKTPESHSINISIGDGEDG